MTPLAAALRGEFARHNRRVLALACLTLIVAASLWYIVYAIVYWLALLGLTMIHGLDVKPPNALPALFIYSGGLLVVITALARHWSPDDSPRDHRSPLEWAADLLLAIPRATLAVWGNLSAWQRLDRGDLELAALVVDRLMREGRLPLYSLPLVIAERACRRKVIFALQLVELIELSREAGVPCLRLSKKGRRMCGLRIANHASRMKRNAAMQGAQYSDGVGV